MPCLLSTTGALPFCHLTPTQEGSMQQPSLFPDHPHTQPEPMVSDRQMVALLEVMSQIVKAFFARARAGASDAESSSNYPRPPGETSPGVRAAIHPQTG